MGSSNCTPGVPEPLAEELASLDDAALRSAVSYGQALLADRSEPTAGVEAAPGEEIVSIDDRGGYTLVAKRQPCADGCDGCPHGPYLYRVRAEPPTGDETRTLHWSFLGRVVE